MEFLNDTALWGNPLTEWLQAMGYFLGSLVMARLVYALFKGVLKRWAARSATKWDDVVVDQVEEPIAMGIVILGFWLGYDHLHFGEGLDSFMEHVFQVLIAIDVKFEAFLQHSRHIHLDNNLRWFIICRRATFP